jgi:hypothetical protein
LENLNKRFKVSAALYNLSQLMKKLFRVGTQEQWAAMGKALFLFLRAVLVSVCALPDVDRVNPEVKPGSAWDRIGLILERWVTHLQQETPAGIRALLKKGLLSTGCQDWLH